MSLDVDSFGQQLENLHPFSRIIVGYSGGCDSHVLLHLLNAVQHKFHFKLIALHVNHGLHPLAEEWTSHCINICKELDIELQVERVSLDRNTGESLEAIARHARYSVYQSYVTDKTTVIALAHHANDQAETVLIQLIRGAGPKGLSAMPVSTNFSKGQMLRPLLKYEQQDIIDYAILNKLLWIDDDSNKDTKHDRNFLRHDIFPALYNRWPGLTKTIHRVSEHQAEAAKLNKVLAQVELASIKHDQEKIDIEKLVSLDAIRCKNILRYWLNDICNVDMPSTEQLQQLINGVLHAKDDAMPQLTWSNLQLRRYQNILYLSEQQEIEQLKSKTWDLREPIQWGELQLTSRITDGQGLSLKIVNAAHITVQSRAGGERCQPTNRQHQHELKKLFQEWRIPTWQRQHVPLIYLDNVLAQVVGHCICHGFEAFPGEPGILIEVTQPK